MGQLDAGHREAPPELGHAVENLVGGSLPLLDFNVDIGVVPDQHFGKRDGVRIWPDQCSENLFYELFSGFWPLWFDGSDELVV